MKTIPAGKFKAVCLDLLNKVKENREEYVITKRGVPFARLAPVEPRLGDPIGWMRGTVINSDAFLEPNDEPWGESESDPLNNP